MKTCVTGPAIAAVAVSSSAGVAELVTRARNEQARHLDRAECSTRSLSGLAGRMKRIADEDERSGGKALGHRDASTSARPSSRPPRAICVLCDGQVRGQAGRSRDDGGDEHGLAVRCTAAREPVREVDALDVHALGRKRVVDGDESRSGPARRWRPA